MDVFWGRGFRSVCVSEVLASDARGAVLVVAAVFVIAGFGPERSHVQSGEFRSPVLVVIGSGLGMLGAFSFGVAEIASWGRDSDARADPCAHV